MSEKFPGIGILRGLFEQETINAKDCSAASEVIVIAEMPKLAEHQITLHIIDCHEIHEILTHRAILTSSHGDRDHPLRVFLAYDLSPESIEALGSGLKLDARVSIYQLHNARRGHTDRLDMDQ